MSHSQFHSTNLFILRHAWLNLWDKHMTTGRINQVTISICMRILDPHTAPVLASGDTFHGGRSLQGFKQCLCEFPHSLRAHSVWKKRTQHICDQRKKHLVPRSHTIPRLALLVQKTKITVFGEDYQQPAHLKSCAQSRRISKVSELKPI